MSARNGMFGVATVVCLAVASGCQGPGSPRSVARATANNPSSVDVYRAQTPGVPGDQDEPSTLARLFRRVRNVTKPRPNEEKSRERFREGDELFVEKKYGDARGKYQSAADLWPNSLVEEDAMFMVAECYFFEDNYPDANDAYGYLLKRHTNSRHLDRVTQRLFAIGKYWQDLNLAKPRSSLNPNFTDKTRPRFDTRGSAVAALETIWTNDLNGPLSDDAVMLTANSHFLAERWASADAYYTQLRQDFPNSPYLIQAYLLGFRAKLEKYKGPTYDAEDLQQASELIETALTQFSDQLGKERDNVLKARAVVQGLKAQRVFERGEYYARGRHYRAARHHYHMTIEKYGETAFAKQAAERIRQFDGLPDKPPQYLTWLANLFPTLKKGPEPIATPTYTADRRNQ